MGDFLFGVKWVDRTIDATKRSDRMEGIAYSGRLGLRIPKPRLFEAAFPEVAATRENTIGSSEYLIVRPLGPSSAPFIATPPRVAYEIGTNSGISLVERAAEDHGRYLIRYPLP